MAEISKLIKTEDNLNFIKTSKYKNINLYFKYSFPFEKSLKARLMLLASLFLETSEKYKTKVEMSRIRDMLYGIGAYCNPSNSSNLLTFTVHFDFINDRFLKGVEAKDYIDYIEEVLKHPYFTDSLLEEAKRTTKDMIKRNLDNPSFLGSDNFFKEISKDDERYEIYRYGSITDVIDDISLAEIKETYELLKDARCDIYLLGDYSLELENYVRGYQKKYSLLADAKVNVLEKRADVCDKKEVSQSTLIVGYTTPFNRFSKEFYAFNLGCILFGGIPSSLLFAEVREKNSLCYTISARSYKSEGLVLVKTLIRAKDKDKTVEEIRKQFNRMCNGDYEDELLDIAKMMAVNNIMGIDDDLDYLIDYNYVNTIHGLDISVDDYIKNLNAVTKEDITNVFKQFKEYMVYFLEGILSE